MTPSSVLAAAAALDEFAVDQLTAYCAGEPHEVRAVLDSFSRYFEMVDRSTGAEEERRWRVVDAAALRAAIGEMSAPVAGRRETARPAGRTVAGRSSDARLLLAEETLVDCAAEPSPAHRRVMARTALNYLQQVVAAGGTGDVDWWDVELLGSHAADGGRGALRSRIRTDVALARMTDCEAAGETMAIDYLIEAAAGTRRLFRSAKVDRQRLTTLLDRFSALARELTTPPRRESAATVCPAAPARLLSAVAWGRADIRAARGGAAAQVLVDLLKGIGRSRIRAESAHPVSLYQVLGNLPRGRQRVVVYTDLLNLLPRQFELALADQVLPGALVEAVAGPAASDHLREYATVIETDLVRSPFHSESALIGQVTHVLQDLAARESRSDGSVVERTDRTCVELLSLAGVGV